MPRLYDPIDECDSSCGGPSRDGWFVAIRSDDAEQRGARARDARRPSPGELSRRSRHEARACSCSRRCVVLWRLRRHEPISPSRRSIRRLSGRPRSRPAPWNIQDKPVPAPPVTLALLRARPGALPHLLHALPFRAGRRPRHDRAARLSRRRPPTTSIGCAQAPVQHFYDVITQRPRRDVFLCQPRAAGGPLGDRRLYPRPAAQPERDRWPTCRPTSGERCNDPAATRSAWPGSPAGVGLIGVGDRLDRRAGQLSRMPGSPR